MASCASEMLLMQQAMGKPFNALLIDAVSNARKQYIGGFLTHIRLRCEILNETKGPEYLRDQLTVAHEG
jgi:hypothetical protein